MVGKAGRSRQEDILESIMDSKARDELALAFGQIVSEAGNLIMRLRPDDRTAQRKPDGSPVCRADVEAEALILARLAALMPGVAVLAEESFPNRRDGGVPDCFLLVDPLDGTREYFAGHDDFTVNVGLIDAGHPVAGAVGAPALGEVYVGGAVAFEAELAAGEILRADALKPIATRALPAAGLCALASRSHLDPQTERWVERAQVKELKRAGSSLKFCLIARGDADVYPRLAPTMEWDTAGGHAVLNAAGGLVLALDGSPLRYGKQEAGFKNAGFVAWGRRPAPGDAS